MRGGLFCVLALTMMLGRAYAVEFCPPQGCPPEPAVFPSVGPAPLPGTGSCGPVQPVMQQTRMVPQQQVVQVPRQRWVTERRTVPCTRTIYVNEPYTTYETRTERRPETRMRQVTRTVRETERRVVNETVYQSYCDPVTGQRTSCPRQVTRTIDVPVKRKVCVQEPYTVNTKYKVRVPVTKYRRVARTVQATREVTERRCVTEMVPQTVTVMRPMVETCAVAPQPML